MTSRCTKCGKTKSTTEFNRNKATSNYAGASLRSTSAMFSEEDKKDIEETK